MQKEITLKDIFVEIQNIKNTMVTKEELKEVKQELQEEIKEVQTTTTKEIAEIKTILQKHTKDIKKMKKDISEVKYVINGLAEDIGMLDTRTRSLVVYGK